MKYSLLSALSFWILEYIFLLKPVSLRVIGPEEGVGVLVLSVGHVYSFQSEKQTAC